MQPRTNYPKLAEKIGERIRQARADAGMRQSDLNENIGKGACYVSHVECGAIVPSLPSLYRIAAALGCDIGDLLPDVPNKTGRWAGPCEDHRPEPAAPRAIGSRVSAEIGRVDIDRMYTAADAARAIGIAERTLRSRRARGQRPFAVQLPGVRSVRWPGAELRAWLAGEPSPLSEG